MESSTTTICAISGPSPIGRADPGRASAERLAVGAVGADPAAGGAGRPRTVRARGQAPELTEAGRIALDYAETMFRAGDELLGTLAGHATRPARPAGRRDRRAVAQLPAGAAAAAARPARTWSWSCGRAACARCWRGWAPATSTSCSPTAGAARRAPGWRNRLLTEQPVSLVGRPKDAPRSFRFPDDLRARPLLLQPRQRHARRLRPGAGTGRHPPRMLAEVDDMAMLRLLARDRPGVTLVPPIVVRDELRPGCWWSDACCPR